MKTSAIFNNSPLAFAALLTGASGVINAATLTLAKPLDYEIVQQDSSRTGNLSIIGRLDEVESNDFVFEGRTVTDGKAGSWQRLKNSSKGGPFTTALTVAAGGWYRLEVRARVVTNDKVAAEASVEHIGVGDLFVIAGQSNSANHGEEKQQTKTGKVAAFDGRRWQLANDPQPGASGAGGSFLPPFGDAMAQRFHVPVGFVACGIGATSVREWLPRGATFPNPPTLVGRVEQLASGEWQSKGEPFAMLVARMRQLGPHGFRAVLWHQGEGDANQHDPKRTLPGNLYRAYLEKIIHESRREIGWDAPWFVAQASYHVPGDEASPDIRAAQASLWKDGIALEGPDTDALKSEFREARGKGVHFSGAGLREHAARWVNKVAPWIENQ
jgi:hypothetical protein